MCKNVALMLDHYCVVHACKPKKKDTGMHNTMCMCKYVALNINALLSHINHLIWIYYLHACMLFVYFNTF